MSTPAKFVHFLRGQRVHCPRADKLCISSPPIPSSLCRLQQLFTAPSSALPPSVKRYKQQQHPMRGKSRMMPPRDLLQKEFGHGNSSSASTTTTTTLVWRKCVILSWEKKGKRGREVSPREFVPGETGILKNCSRFFSA